MEMKAGEEGVRAFSKGDYLSAIINLDAALFGGSSNPDYYKIRGLSYMHLGEMIAAIKDFSTLIEQDKSRPEYFIQRGYLYEKIGFLPRAVADYRQALRFNSYTWDALEKTSLFMDLSKMEKDACINDEGCRQFLIVANPRTGSTWLELMLNCLPDVDADLEFKWSNQSNLILSIDDIVTPTLTNSIYSLTFSEALDAISKGNITGSKLIIDFNAELPDFKVLYRSLDPKKIRIIHLTRNYHEIIASVRYGFYHVKNENHIETKKTRLYSVLGSEVIAHESPEMPQEALLSYIDALFKIDVFFKSLENEFEYMSIDYSRINQDFYKTAKYIGSSVDEEFVLHLLSNPPTKKVQPPYKQGPHNDSYELIERYEQYRKNLLGLE